MEAHIVTDLSDARRLAPAWDELAVAAGVPFSAPDWLLPWWKHVAPAGSPLAIVAVTESDRLVGVAPFFTDRRSRPPRTRLLGSGTALRVAPLGLPGLEGPVASAFASALVDSVRLVTLEGISATPPWGTLLGDRWGEGARMHREWAMPAPVLDLDGSRYDKWFASKSPNFRQQMRRDRRNLEEAGATFRLTSPNDDIATDIAAFVRLHRSRWAHRGGSATMHPEVEAMLEEAARALIPSGRLRLWNVEVGGETISSHLFLCAGSEVSYWLGGFDDRWAAMRPGMQVLLTALEHAWAKGDGRFDLGPGGDGYKYRFTDDHDVVEWWSIVPPGRGRVVASMSLWPQRVRRMVGSKVPAPVKARLKSFRRVGR